MIKVNLPAVKFPISFDQPGEGRLVIRCEAPMKVNDAILSINILL